MLQHPDENAIPTATCWELLGHTQLGRVALSIGALPVILPVEYSVQPDALAICLNQYAVDDRNIDNVVVGFAADAIDPATRAGWTVQVQGMARLSGRPDDPADCGQPLAGRIVFLDPQTITGQRFQLCPFVPPLDP
jgi:hypothetical protein